MDELVLLRSSIRSWLYHRSKFRIVEEDDRFVFILDPCGSGGRLYRGEFGNGRYVYGKGMMDLMKEPADINNRRR